MKSNKKKYLILIFLLFSLISVRADSDFEILKNELVSFAGNDTVTIFGTFCSACHGNFYSRYFLSSAHQTKIIVIDDMIGDSKKIFDSTFVSSETEVVVEYAKNNLNSISNQFDSLDFFTSIPSKNGIDSSFSVFPAIGNCYFLGIYSKDRFTYTFFSDIVNVNRFYNNGNYLWTYFSLLKNQFM